MKFIFLSFKRNILPFILMLFTFFLVVFSKSNLTATKNGLLLWANSIVPSLFPFFVIVDLLSHTNIINHIGKLCDKIMKPFFNIPGEAAFALIMGFISGYPTGAKIVSNLYEQGKCTKDEAERMLCFTNNSGPLFILSFVGISLFGDTKTGLLLLFTHILSSITVGIIFGKLSSKKLNNKSIPLKKHYSVYKSKEFQQSCTSEKLSFGNFGKLLGFSIKNAISTVLLIGGFVVIFSVVISILTQSHILEYSSKFLYPILHMLGFNLNFAEPILAGIIELTNGINMTASVTIKLISQNIIICAFLLGFGGISVLFQVFSMVSHTDLSIKKYIIGKLLQGLIAALYTFLLLSFIPSFCLDI